MLLVKKVLLMPSRYGHKKGRVFDLRTKVYFAYSFETKRRKTKGDASIPIYISVSLPLIQSPTIMGNLNANLVLPMLALLLSSLPLKGASNTDEYIPVTPVKYLTLANVPGGVLAGYNQCSDCRCCSANNPSNCVTTKCCYKLVCYEATNPAAKCSFRPAACNCDNCS
ncbi:hypothetical protein C4D60_Mb07t00890 [Musa balbisiana]|uniref:DUF7866 domain-containing protein n=1 Tax=Musa balbisiana TaxID=52838 RepID=A0A4S8JC23_MUSBA|nr:hypothetical protein C4D60_Mb07t00890 [Musa balbisiana]